MSMSRNDSVATTSNCSAYLGRPGSRVALKMQGESGPRFQSSGLKEQRWSQTRHPGTPGGEPWSSGGDQPGGPSGKVPRETVSKHGRVLSNRKNWAEKDMVQRIQGRNEHILAQEPHR